MKNSIQNNCITCKSTTEQVDVGFVPVSIFDDTELELWRKSSVCSECGTLNDRGINNEDIENAEDRIIDALVEVDEMEGNEADKLKR